MTLPPIQRTKREKRKKTLPDLSVYQPKQSRTKRADKDKNNNNSNGKKSETEDRAKVLQSSAVHSRNIAFIQQLQERSRQMRQLETQEVERVNAFRERLRKRVMKQVSQTSKDFAIAKAEKEKEKLTEQQQQQQEARERSAACLYRSSNRAALSASPRQKLTARTGTATPPPSCHSPSLPQTPAPRLRRPTTAFVSDSTSLSKSMGLEKLQQVPRPKTSHTTKPRQSDLCQGGGLQGAARLRMNRIMASTNPTTSTSTSTSMSPTFATTVRIYRSIQCNPNPSLKRYLMWKKRNNIPFEAKVFTISGEKNFFYIRKALLNRGWIENKDSSTEFFDLKWSLHSADIKHINLRQDQFVNHFEHASSITTKCGLLKTLKDLSLSASVDAPGFYPRSYDLSTEEGRWEFDKDFEMTASLSVLKRAWADLYTGKRAHLDQTVQLAIDAWRARLRHMKNMVDEDFEADTPWLPKLRVLQWQEILSSDIFQKPAVPLDVLKAMDNMLISIPKSPKKIEVQDQEIADLSREEMSSAASSMTEEIQIQCKEEENPPVLEVEGSSLEHPKTAAGDCDILVISDDMSLDSSSASGENFVEEEDSNGEEQTSENQMRTLEKLMAEIAHRYPQFHIDGMHNIWIVKPGGKSRGRGIKCFNKMQDIWTYLREDLSEKWIVQKYIERPLIVYGRKFDIRQWVLVTDWNPLTVWVYKEFYLRFAVENFDLLDLDSYAHLCNNSIVKNSDKFENAAHTIESDGNMWSMEQLENYLGKELQEVGAVEEKIVPQINSIITQSLRSAQYAVKERKETCQVFGYDFVVDDNLNVWLLEINSSPTMEPSTALTARLCKQFQEDTVKVIVDLPNEQQRRQKSGEGRIKLDNPPPEFDLGSFQCIVSDNIHVKQPKYVGLNLVVDGKRYDTHSNRLRRKRRQSQISEVYLSSNIPKKSAANQA